MSSAGSALLIGRISERRDSRAMPRVAFFELAIFAPREFEEKISKMLFVRETRSEELRLKNSMRSLRSKSTKNA